MIDAEAVLARAERGQVPGTWRVFYAKKPATTLIGILYGLSILLLLWIAIGALAAYSLAFPLNISSFLANNLVRLALVVSVVIAVVFGILTAARAAVRARYTLLVVMPDGIVQRIGISRQSIKTLSFADITSMKMKMHTASNSTKVTIYIEVQYSDGRTEKWVPAPGPADEIAQLIIAWHAQYIALRDPQASSQPAVLSDASELG
jgi:hypothetical protein